MVNLVKPTQTSPYAHLVQTTANRAFKSDWVETDEHALFILLVESVRTYSERHNCSVTMTLEAIAENLA